jgi:hypothetical protein
MVAHQDDATAGVWEMSADEVRFVDAHCPGWARATVVYTDAAGLPVGYGHIDRDGRTAEIMCGPAGVRLLCEAPPARGT